MRWVYQFLSTKRLTNSLVSSDVIRVKKAGKPSSKGREVKSPNSQSAFSIFQEASIESITSFEEHSWPSLLKSYGMQFMPWLSSPATLRSSTKLIQSREARVFTQQPRFWKRPVARSFSHSHRSVVRFVRNTCQCIERRVKYGSNWKTLTSISWLSIPLRTLLS